MFVYDHQINNRSRSLRIKVSGAGRVVVTTPPRVPIHQIEEFVRYHQQWIEDKLSRIAQQPQVMTTDAIWIFGSRYELKKQVDPVARPGIKVDQATRVIKVVILNEKKFNPTLERFIKNTAEKYLIPRLYQLSTKMDLSFKKVSLRNQKTRWGSCSSHGTISLNWKLVHFAPQIIDYVLIHELAHVRHMNHSTKFWALVAKFDPAYRSHQRELSKWGVDLG